MKAGGNQRARIEEPVTRWLKATGMPSARFWTSARKAERIASAGVVGPADASTTKVFGTEFAVEAYRLLTEVLGASGGGAEVRDWAASAKLASGERVLDAEWVRLNLARVHAKAEFLKLMNWRIASSAAAVGPAAASATKVFGTEFAVEAYRLLMEVLGASALVRSGSPGAALAGRIERLHRAALILTFGGGTNEVQRDIIATVGLGLPAARR